MTTTFASLPPPDGCPGEELPIEEILARNEERRRVVGPTGLPWRMCPMAEVEIDRNGDPVNN